MYSNVLFVAMTRQNKRQETQKTKRSILLTFPVLVVVEREPARPPRLPPEHQVGPVPDRHLDRRRASRGTTRPG